MAKLFSSPMAICVAWRTPLAPLLNFRRQLQSSSSGRPGTQASVLLRGPTMINAQGRSQEPLYIVDGIVINGNLPDLNPNDIESVEVVKGAAGSSLYGARAGNGVIQITTKSGRHAADGIKFSVRSEAGMSDIERDFGLARFHAQQHGGGAASAGGAQRIGLNRQRQIAKHDVVQAGLQSDRAAPGHAGPIGKHDNLDDVRGK